jgi:hypothetical protein
MTCRTGARRPLFSSSESFAKALARFINSLYPDGGCVCSALPVNGKGYPQLSYNEDGINYRLFAHQLSARLKRAGAPLDADSVVHHICGNKLCVKHVSVQPAETHNRYHAEKKRRR